MGKKKFRLWNKIWEWNASPIIMFVIGFPIFIGFSLAILSMFLLFIGIITLLYPIHCMLAGNKRDPYKVYLGNAWDAMDS